jgi:hypothetical protein
MELLTKILTGGIGSKILADEIKAWCPAIAHRIVNRAAQRLALDIRERYEEEWTSNLAQIPGSVSQVLFAIDLYRAAFAINTFIRKSQRLQKEKAISLLMSDLDEAWLQKHLDVLMSRVDRIVPWLRADRLLVSQLSAKQTRLLMKDISHMLKKKGFEWTP